MTVCFNRSSLPGFWWLRHSEACVLQVLRGMVMNIKTALWKLRLAIKRDPRKSSGSDDIDHTSMRHLCSTLGLLSRSRLAHSLHRPSARLLSVGPSKPDTSDTSDTPDSAAPWSYDRATSWLKKFTKEDIPRGTSALEAVAT